MGFRYSNRSYCRLIYEYTGVWAKRVMYAQDNSEYRFYFTDESAKVVSLQVDRISQKVEELEHAHTSWNMLENCLILYV